MAENVKKSGAESYPVTTGIIGEIKKWYWVLLAILSLTATAFYATAKITYKPVYQSYASLTPSLRDAATADTIEKLAGELMDKAKDGRLAEALGETGAADADIRFVADGLDLAVSVRAASPEASYETLRGIADKGVELLDEKPDYSLVLTADSGMPKTVTNPLDTGAAAMRGLLVGAALSIAFLFLAMMWDKKRAAVPSVESESEPAYGSMAEAAPRTENPPVPEFAMKAEPVSEPVPARETAAVSAPEPVIEPVPAPVIAETPAMEPAAAPEKSGNEKPAHTGGVPADLARFASALGASFFDALKIPDDEPVEEASELPAEEEVVSAPAEEAASVPAEEEAAYAPAEEEVVSAPAEEVVYVPAEEEESLSVPAEEEDVPDEAPETSSDNSSDDEEWDPAKTTLSKEMWEIAREMGMLDDFRI
ncbi:MAG: hypothetical protein VZQ82_08195 [Lachnospiraceae bacterium]|nr:hypothetical protein [Lachnospiraceae bacterium]